MSERAYKVEPTKGKCSHCESENVTYFDVIGPDGYAQGTTFAEEVDAEEHANCLNGAYDEGRKSLAGLPDCIRRVAAMIHSSHHSDIQRPWTTCAVITCRMAQEAITKAGGTL